MPTLFLTGSTGALGSAIRSHYLNAGWSVAGFSYSDDSFTSKQYRFYAVDITSESSTEEAFQKAASEMGVPDALVATVGGIRSWKPVAETSVDDFRALLDLNLVSFFVSAKQALKLMDKGGAIVSIGAESALDPSARKGGYVASKAGVIALTRVIAEEGKSSGITANCLVPTIIRSKGNEEWGNPDDFSKWTPPEDMAAMCFFLTSEPGKSVNGAVIRMPNRM